LERQEICIFLCTLEQACAVIIDVSQTQKEVQIEKIRFRLLLQVERKRHFYKTEGILYTILLILVNVNGVHTPTTYRVDGIG
jgi:hypothetical protein